MESNMYLQSILNKYAPRSIDSHSRNILLLKVGLQRWASTCYISTINSGSRAKGTAISMASDVDDLISLTSNCNATRGGLRSIYDSLHTHLKSKYNLVRKQNVSFRINISDLEIDI